MENRDSVDQKTAAKLAAIGDLVGARRDIFSRQGSVVATKRTYGGRSLGPFYSLRFRDEGRQRAVYLGRSQVLAGRVESLLSEARTGLRERRLVERLRRQARARLRQCKAMLQKDLAMLGLRLKGFEIRRRRDPSVAMTAQAHSAKEE